jgi:hypothetical protein
MKRCLYCSVHLSLSSLSPLPHTPAVSIRRYWWLKRTRFVNVNCFLRPFWRYVGSDGYYSSSMQQQQQQQRWSMVEAASASFLPSNTTTTTMTRSSSQTTSTSALHMVNPKKIDSRVIRERNESDGAPSSYHRGGGSSTSNSRY